MGQSRKQAAATSSEQSGATVYRAVEMVTAKGYLVYIEADKQQFGQHVGRLVDSAMDYDTYALGTVKAGSEQEAVDKIRRGDWQFSQRR